MNESTANVKHITGSDFPAEVMQSPLPVVVDFYATWCGPCRRLAPRLDRLAGTFTNRVKFLKVNIDESSALAQQFQFQAIPTVIIFKNGRVVDRMLGLPDEEAFKKQLAALAAGK